MEEEHGGYRGVKESVPKNGMRPERNLRISTNKLSRSTPEKHSVLNFEYRTSYYPTIKSGMTTLPSRVRLSVARQTDAARYFNWIGTNSAKFCVPIIFQA
jgi:hypothetical protein